MNRNKLKIIVGILAFIIGVTTTAIWLIDPLSLNSISEVSPPEVLVAEEAEEYAVYSVVIENLYLKKMKLREPLLISNRTSPYGNWESAVFGDDFPKGMTAEQRVSQLKTIAPSVSKEALFDFDEKQMQSKELRPKFDLRVEYLLVNEHSKEGYLTERSIRFSSVGFNKQRNQAYVFTRFVCSALCSSSDFLVLEKVEGNWEVKEIIEGIRS
jgi:hypothetical protein